MAVHRLFEKGALGPYEIALLSEAYEKVLEELKLVPRDDAMTQLVARRVIRIFQTGARNPDNIARRVLDSFNRS